MIPAREIHVVTFSLVATAERLVACQRVLSPDETARARRFHQAADRRRYIAARGELRMTLARYLDRGAAELRLRYGSHGKPALPDGHGDERLRFNTSRSHEVGLITLRLDHDLGVDLERIRPFPDALSVAERLFAPEEHRTLCALAADERDAAFFGYWTRKEALVKCIGLGLSHPLNTFALPPLPDPAPQRVTMAGGDGGTEATWWLLPLPPLSPGYVAALATAGPPCAVRLVRHDGHDEHDDAATPRSLQ